MKYLISLTIVFFTWNIFSQNIKLSGTVSTYIDGKSTAPLFGAEIFLKTAKSGDISDENGKFSIETSVHLPDTLLIRASGYYTDTIIINEIQNSQYKITLFPEFVAEEVVITAKRANSNIMRLDPRNVEQLNRGELKKAACCSLSESFETNATVDVNVADGVSGSRRIQMMGLEGKYIQLQFENIPFMHNLDQPFGLATIPGTWIESIQITKGTGTVTNGYESMSGLINVEYLQPHNIERIFVNGYTSIQGRGEFNIHGGGKINDKWGTAWFAHGASLFMENDRNKDGFRDIPLGNSLIGMSRWNYSGENIEQKFGIKANYSDHQGGQIGFKRYTNQSQQNLYGAAIRNSNVELFSKTGIFIHRRPLTSVGIIAYLKHNELNTAFGKRLLDAQENRGYLNALFETYLGNSNHVIKSGLSFVYDEITQEMRDELPKDTSVRNLIRTELVPGIFSEYTYSGIRSVIVLGARGDYHNLYGFQFTPRANYKFNFSEDLSLRLTAGRGFRVSNYMTDNLSLMSTNLPWIVDKDIQPEVSWNFGGSWLWNFKLLDRGATFSTDFYHTLFENQLMIDRDESVDYIRMTNLSGVSFSNAFQIDLQFEPLERFEIKTAYKFLDVRGTTGGTLKDVIMIPKHRGFINMAYETRNRRWSYDATLSVIGRQRLATVFHPDLTMTINNNLSRPYPMLSAQITHRFKKFEIYLGGENLTDYRLKNPIIDVENPFGSKFDATRIYAPIYGINIYAGFRLSINNK